jgi:cyclopropane-fatty-acyl-phospholipid synthase
VLPDYAVLRSPFAAAETQTLAAFCAFAGVVDGTTILDLGCGWGSLCLYLCEAFPRCTVYALSNSTTQRAYIEAQYRALVTRRGELGTAHLTVVCGDIGSVQPEGWAGRFDTILSVEMFEHMQNYRALYEKLNGWLGPRGNLVSASPLFFSLLDSLTPLSSAPAPGPSSHHESVLYIMLVTCNLA